MASSSVYLPYDLIACVIGISRDDYSLLYQCSLVNREFNQAVTQILYSHVVLCAPFQPVLNLSNRSSIPVSSLRGSTLQAIFN